MGEEDNNGISKIKKWVTLTISIFTLVALISGGVWTLNSTYASKSHVKAVETNAEKGRILLAEESVKTLQQFQDKMRQEQIQRQIKNDVRYWAQLIDEVNCKIKDIENQLAKQSDTYLKNRLQEEKKRLEQYKQKLDELLK